MYVIIFFGALTIGLSLLMVINPKRWGDYIVRFSQMRGFHTFEVLSRMVIGVVFLAYANQTAHPKVMSVFGYLLLAVGIGLSFLPPSSHKRFTLWAADKFRNIFRPASLASLAFGIFLIYSALEGPAAG